MDRHSIRVGVEVVTRSRIILFLHPSWGENSLLALLSYRIFVPFDRKLDDETMTLMLTGLTWLKIWITKLDK